MRSRRIEEVTTDGYAVLSALPDHRAIVRIVATEARESIDVGSFVTGMLADKRRAEINGGGSRCGFAFVGIAGDLKPSRNGKRGLAEVLIPKVERRLRPQDDFASNYNGKVGVGQLSRE